MEIPLYMVHSKMEKNDQGYYFYRSQKLFSQDTHFLRNSASPN